MSNSFRQPDAGYLDDGIAVQLFAVAMTNKMIRKSQEGYSGWWDGACSIDDLWRKLRAHVRKGDPVDIANFAMMIWHRQQDESR